MKVKMSLKKIFQLKIIINFQILRYTTIYQNSFLLNGKNIQKNLKLKNNNISSLEIKKMLK